MEGYDGILKYQFIYYDENTYVCSRAPDFVEHFRAAREFEQQVHPYSFIALRFFEHFHAFWIKILSFFPEIYSIILILLNQNVKLIWITVFYTRVSSALASKEGELFCSRKFKWNLCTQKKKNKKFVRKYDLKDHWNIL